MYQPQVGDVVRTHGQYVPPGGDPEEAVIIADESVTYEIKLIAGKWARLMPSGVRALLEENATPYVVWPVDQLAAAA